MSNFRDGRKNRYRMSGDSTTPAERWHYHCLFSISIYQEIKTWATPTFQPLSLEYNQPGDLEIQTIQGPLKISRKWRSEVVKSGWEGCEPISMRPAANLYDPDWRGSYTISLPRFRIHLYFLLTKLSSDIRHSHFNHSPWEQNIRGEPPAASDLSPIIWLLV